MLAATIVILYYFFDPGQSELAPKCLFLTATGFLCPGCGSQRMLHAFLHGDLAAAWHANPFLICLAPLLILMIIASATRTRWPRLYATVNSTPVTIAVGIAIITWTIWRNLSF